MNDHDDRSSLGLTRDGSRLHVCMGEICNNNCLFCMDQGGRVRQRHLELIDRQQILGFLAQNVALGEVLFTAGEPTLHPDLPILVREARKLGYRSIGVITNGRRMSYLAYTEGLLKAGLNHVVVSIHGHEARLHDALTRTPGSFSQTVAGLRILSGLRGRYPLRLSTSTVVNRRNLPALRAIVDFLLSFDVDQVVLNAIQPLGRGDVLFDRLVPRYREIADAVRGAVAGQGERRGRVRLVDVPPCILLGIPEECRGWVEEHQHYERSPGLPAELGRPRSAPLQAPVQKRDFDAIQRAFGPPCEACPLRGGCDGVWKRYVREHGWDEFGVP